jgi:hypothetical protein
VKEKVKMETAEAERIKKPKLPKKRFLKKRVKRK